MRKNNYSALLEGSQEAEHLPQINYDDSWEIIIKTRLSSFIVEEKNNIY